jgi:predicted small lipoprotein YifL
MVRYIACYQALTKCISTVQVMNKQYRLTLVLGLLFVVGCGQKAALYLPGNPSQIKTDVPRQDQSQIEADEKNEERKES